MENMLPIHNSNSLQRALLWYDDYNRRLFSRAISSAGRDEKLDPLERTEHTRNIHLILDREIAVIPDDTCRRNAAIYLYLIAQMLVLYILVFRN